MPVLLENQIAVSIELGGVEDGSASWGSPTTVTCPTESLTISGEAVAIDVTQRCDTITTTRRVRDTFTLTHNIDGDSSTGWPYGTTPNQYVRVTVTEASLTARVYTGVIRSNEISHPMGQRSRQTVRIEVQSIA